MLSVAGDIGGLGFWKNGNAEGRLEVFKVAGQVGEGDSTFVVDPAFPFASLDGGGATVLHVS